MPTYLYAVVKPDGEFGEEFEIEQAITEPPLTQHPETGEPVERLLQPVFAGGTWTESSMNRRMKDEKKLGKLGLTKYVKAGDGVYEKRSGEGPRTITRDNPITAADVKKITK